MAVNPVSQPLSPGLLEVDYSPWDAAAAARSGAPGGLLGSPAIAPLSAPSWTGGSQFGNYVRANPGLENLFNTQTTAGSALMPAYEPNIAKYGKAFWDKYGAVGGWVSPGATPASPYVSLGDVMDTAPATAGHGPSGLPMPDVEGYKYVYPKYEWNSSEGWYEQKGYEEDIDKYPYYPYYPGDSSDRLYDDSGSMLDNILVGLRLIKK